MKLNYRLSFVLTYGRTPEHSTVKTSYFFQTREMIKEYLEKKFEEEEEMRYILVYNILIVHRNCCIRKGRIIIVSQPKL